MSAGVINVLLAEDDAAHAEAIRRATESAPAAIDLRVVDSLKAFRSAVDERAPDVAVMDLNLADGRADEVLQLLPTLDTFPIVVMTSFGDEQTAVAAIKAGALDYIVKSSEAFVYLPERILRVMGEWDVRRDRARALKALRDREALYRAVIETSADGFWMADIDGRILEVNEAYVRMSGYSRDELLTMRIADLEARESPQEVAAHIEALFLQRTDIFESQHRKKDGTVWQVEIDTAAWPIEAGRCFVFIRDITQRRRSQYLMRLRAQVASEAGAKSVDELLQFALDQMELLTGSSIGFFHFVDPDQEHLRLQTWSTNTLATMCTAEGKGQHYAVRDAGVWADCIRERKPLIHNDYASLPGRKGMPVGHAVVARELVIPVMTGGTVLAVCGVGNKSTDYTPEDVDAVETIASMVTDLALRKQTQEEFENFFGLVPDLVCIANDQGYFHRLNLQWERLLGYSLDELMRVPSLSFVHPDDRDATVRAFNPETQDRRPVKGLVNRYRAKDGSWRWIEWNATPMSPGSRLIFAAARDISERKQFEIDLENATSELERFFALVPDMICIASTEGRLLRINDAWETILGFTKAELLGAPLSSLIHPDDVAATFREIQTQLNGERTAGFVNRYRCKDGSYRFLEWVATPAVGGNLYAAARDITGRMETEADLRRSKMWMDIHMQNTPLAVIEWDTNLNVLDWNPAAERIFGYTKAEALGRHFLTFVPAPSKDAVSRVGSDLVGRRGGTRSTNLNVTKDGRIIDCDWFNTTLVDADGRTIGVASLVMDVTAQHQLEAQLRQTQRMEAVGQLAGGVAHDYNNILAAMMMHLGLLQERRGLPPDVQQTVEDVHKLAERSAALTRQLLMFSRRSVLTIRTINLNMVITDLLKMLQRLIGEHVAFEFIGEPSLPSIQADSGMMEQVVTNLCVNARDAMPKGGRLTVWTSRLDIDPERAAQHPDARVGQFVCLSVRDSGTGMSEDVLQRIFEPFFTTKEAGKGTGLGLATVFGIVKQHNGWIEVESLLGAGSVFRVFLPADSTEVELATAATKPRAQGGTETILVVEDDEAVRRTVTLVLRRFGYRVLQAASGPEALEVWGEQREAVALLYTDMVMPGGMTGLDVARQCLEQKPGLKVIISSGYSGDLVGSAAASETEFVFVPKPVASDDLIRMVRQTLDGTPPG